MNAVAPLIPCIVSGGSGTRLWPVSRESMPKPFMRLADDQSLLQKTFLRIAGLPDVARLLTVTNRDLLFRTLDDYRAVNRSGLAQDLLLEPMGRNTAPAIAAAALHVQEHFGDQAQLLILPADHLIRDEQAFAAAVAEARGLAAQGYLVTFGITPERAETGFGYIEQGAPLGNGFRVARFVEKPDQATAQSYLDSGKYLWNAGMFCFQAATVLQELERHAPEVLIAARAALADGSSLENGQCRQRELAAGAFAEAPDISVDYALMERSDKVAVVPCSIGWSDIGSWQALRELSAADENGNQVRGESVLHDVSNCYIDSPKRLVGAVGVHDLIIVDTPDALLVADAARSQDVKFVAQELKRRGHDAFRLHRTVSRPWGTYTVLEEGRRFKIKRIVVRPKASLSLQMHHHRSEHWIVVSGMALVENGEREFLLNTNESTIGVAYGRQLPHPGAGLLGAQARRFNYPPESRSKRLADASELGIKTCFSSDSFSAYRSDALAAVGGFPEDVIGSEDAYVAARLLQAGYAVRYAASAEVYHSHDYRLLEEFRRYFDIGVFYGRERWIRAAFGGAGGEGKRYVLAEIQALRAAGALYRVPEIALRSAFKLLGYRLGQLERHLPVALKRRISMFPGYWK
ncbi:TPA: mannose-1-phosphate guanylyltransferase/mannose-6-phosphate isomerase [Pseudomonas aeruginosa]